MKQPEGALARLAGLDLTARLIPALGAMLTIGLIGVPLAMLVYAALRGPSDFLPFEDGAHYTLDNLRGLISDPALVTRILPDTLVFVAGTVCLTTVIAFALAFLFMYMILAAQFESLVHPITILLALPLTIPFAILSLILLRTNLDIYAMFGLFMLFGIVKKNGILQVDYTNVLRSRGVPRDRAILEANAVRLRPILMTTVMLVAAMIPMAMGEGPGAASRAGMAKVILGGQLLSLLLTLLLTPVAYSLWDDLTVAMQRLSAWLGRGGSRGGQVAVVPEPSDGPPSSRKYSSV
jgi:hypothetical protein